MFQIFLKYLYKWLQMYDVARQYYMLYGDLEVPSRYNSQFSIGKNGEKLWNWISVQRQKYQNDKLTPKQIQLLEDIDMVWDGRYYDINSYIQFDESKLVIPKIPQIIEIVDLIENNEDINYKWLRMYEMAKRYFLINGHLVVPNHYKYQYPLREGGKLANWISSQKTKYRNRKLSQKQIQLLEKIGMLWDNYTHTSRYEFVPELDFDKKALETMIDIINDHDWLQMYEFADRYYTLYGNLDIQNQNNSLFNSESSIRELYQWVLEQLNNYNNNLLGEEKINLLEKIGIINFEHKKSK